jgi:hypothetical protein
MREYEYEKHVYIIALNTHYYYNFSLLKLFPY